MAMEAARDVDDGPSGIDGTVVLKGTATKESVEVVEGGGLEIVVSPAGAPPTRTVDVTSTVSIITMPSPASRVRTGRLGSTAMLVSIVGAGVLGMGTLDVDAVEASAVVSVLYQQKRIPEAQWAYSDLDRMSGASARGDFHDRESHWEMPMRLTRVQ